MKDLVTSIVGFDWSTLADSAFDATIEFAKEEAGDLAEFAKAQLRDKWKTLDWKGLQSKYKSNLLDALSTTKILGNPTPIKIETIYTDCFVFDRPSALTYFSGDIRSLEKNDQLPRNEVDRLSALEVALTGESLFILGKPGAGKTTFLKYLAILACKNEINKSPIFIPLKEWSDSNLPIEKFISNQFDLCGFPKAEPFVTALLSKGNALVLLDGLDEVNEEGGKRNQTIKEVVNLSLKYRKCQFCLTCRTAATDYSFERFKYLEVADFTENQKLSFIRQWYGSKSGQLDRFLTGWNEVSNAGIRDLGRTPLLITLLCLAFDETLQFPTRQVDLYREAIDALLRKWDSSRLIGRDGFYKNLSFSRREHLLEYIAAHFYFNSQTIFPRKNIEHYILDFLNRLPDKEKSGKSDAAIVLKQIEAQHGLLVERAKDIYSFSHLTIQEYFTASYIAQSNDNKILEGTVEVALKDQKWREVILYTVALLPSADPILKKMVSKLHIMRGNDAGVVKFLAYCYCTAMSHKNPHHHIDGYLSADISDLIISDVEKSKSLPLTSAEVSKIAEHLTKIRGFLISKEAKYEFGNASAIFITSEIIFSSKPLLAAKFLGGHKARPEDFTSYLYACRLMIECLEVAVSDSRSTYLTSVMSIDNETILHAAGIR
ncbi:NACHT domain-containing protein [Rhodoferax sp. U2-2l]|uniref:NACHT domain-containing protein n=1 Tax=Rhodoferax sp. U2-2l TaxID=2884000 RepID=UPI001D0B66C5|nr:NACHT domain-containing protein [Rhodoferax sp. U2-2l]MCB8748449.1 NACHT domain-containing protein [Rhodoferax sp. U2-2l]